MLSDGSPSCEVFATKKEASKAYNKQIVIEHISSETGHTEMECDHLHLLIERSIKRKDLFSTQYYVESTIKSFYLIAITLKNKIYA